MTINGECIILYSIFLLSIIDDYLNKFWSTKEILS
jgi:hypothetical protein